MRPSIKNISFDFFSVVMGITGLGLAWRSAANEFGVPTQIGEAIIFFGIFIFVFLILFQLVRIAYFRPFIIEEWRDASHRNFFCAATISGLLISQSLLPYSESSAIYLWVISVSAQVVFLWFMLRHWLLEEVSHNELSPAWLIPMVGNASPSFAGIELGHAVFCKILFTSALLCWATFLPLIFYRIIFVIPKISSDAMPGLAILVSAPAVLAIAEFNLSGGASTLIEFLAWTALFFAVVVYTLGRRLVSSRFSRRWWAFTFPSAALASSLIRVYHTDHNSLNLILAYISLGVSTSIVLYVSLRSLYPKSHFSDVAKSRSRK
ncbi:C4-dicarboxylate transporter [Pseudomonas viridiflava]|uniref:SLAC1 family transporter n=1 Tax=Pseudomonas viridiflava TaxID=33069 RepID=UPI000F01A4B6